jgi:co-chaperonin GroES (HSP10)
VVVLVLGAYPGKGGSEEMSEEVKYDVSRIRPVGAKLFIRKGVQKEPEYIILPEHTKETTNFCEILAIGNKCKFFGQDHVGKLVQVPDSADGLHFIVEGSSEYAIVNESVLEPIVYDE